MRRLLAVAAFAVALWAAPGALAAGWCGSGEDGADRPDMTTGQQVHAIYAVPADGADNFTTVANRLADDTTSIDAWWVTQDSARNLRFDQAVFSGCTGLDISFLRLPEAASAFGNTDSAFSSVVRDVEAAGFVSTAKKYLVYYDAPGTEADVCGTGGGDFGGFGVAIVWLAGCPDVPTDGVAAHELLHAMGALPDGAPHECPDHPMHPCDSTQDVLYPYASGLPLAQLLLDAGHDDYYAHSGSWLDLQDSPWLHRLDLPQQPLAVAFSGAGTVTADLPGLACTAACTTQWDQGSQMTLTALGTATSRFLGWQGACTGSDPCSVTVAQPVNVTARFGPLHIPVRVTTTGRGRVSCSPACSSRFLAGDYLALRAVPTKGWRFAGWAGACHGTRPVCAPATDFALNVRAIFKRKR